MSAPSLTGLRWFTQVTLVSGVPLLWVFAVVMLGVSHGWGPLTFALAAGGGAVAGLAGLLLVRAVLGAAVTPGERMATGVAGVMALAGVGAAAGWASTNDLLAAGGIAGLVCSGAGLRAREGRRLPATVLALVAVAAVAAAAGAPRGDFFSFVLPALILPPAICLVVVAQTWTYEVARRLESARSVAGELAVAEERVRFAADLHDIQGHHLQVIALKSELAARLGPSRTGEATALMREVRQLAHDALADTKAVVGGYRRVSLRTELANAGKVLTAAGVLAETHVTATVAGTAEPLLGLVVREATTNILRHSTASAVRLSLTTSDGTTFLTVTNDGVDRPHGLSGDAARQAPGEAGSGLRVLAERLEQVGGRLSWKNTGDRFTVTATLAAA
ncbi:sensor histidine kinase [Nonomuraea sp. NPDC050547]|uniref:sensor histidine kinase n=1 Tax=Nonomuraea sp. NPDC050547 TaxID=3364368 RepID=UPI0037B3E53C